MKTFNFRKPNVAELENGTVEVEPIQAMSYKKAVKSFQNKHPKLKEVVVEWVKDGVNLSKLQKLPMGRKKKLGR